MLFRSERHIGGGVAVDRPVPPIAQPGTEVVAETGEGPFSQALSVGGRMNSYQWA